MPIDTGPYTHTGVGMRDLLVELADAAATALLQTPNGMPLITGLFHDQPPEDCPDAIQMWVREWVPIVPTDFPTVASTTDSCRGVELMPRVVLSLRRRCASVPDEDGFVDAAEDRAYAADLIIDVRALTCGVAATWPAILQARFPGARFQYGAITAAGANTNVLGWDWEILIETQGCKAACGQ